MKHVLAAFDWLGITPDPEMLDSYTRYAALLTGEGVRAGVIGPNEADRVDARHIADSICFAVAAEGSRWLDVGTGGGLPGLPLAIARPDVEMTLLDRSGRRIDALRRWVRILGLDNVEVVRGDIEATTTRFDTLFFRGSLPLEAARATTSRLARQVGVFGLTHGAVDRPSVPHSAEIELIEIPESILDSAAALLRITP